MTTNKKIFVSMVIPCYNEEAILFTNLNTIIDYLESKSDKYQWEIVLVNDGSKDKTGDIADAFAKMHANIRVIHHVTNLNLGGALQTGFRNCCGEVIVVMDIDLSYSAEHIERMVDTLVQKSADIVIASPYMKGGKVTSVPFLRKMMSIWVNKFMRLSSQEKFFTFTGMVRAYRSKFIKGLNLKTKDYEINPEILYKAMILRARIIEIPAHLDWTEQNKYGLKRTSGMRVLKTFFSGLMAGFIFRPYIFFLGVGFIMLLISIYLIGWIFYFTFHAIPTIPLDPQAYDDRFSLAIKLIYQQRPHLFFLGGITLLAALQILSLGFLSLQSKRYFEELFHINSSIFKQNLKISSDEKH